MKKFNSTFALVLIACFLLSFTAINNFSSSSKASLHIEGAEFSFPSFTNKDSMAAVKIEELVKKELISPIKACMKKHDPNIFMTKCYINVTFELQKEYPSQKVQFNTPMKGAIIYSGCGSKETMATIWVTHEDEKIVIRESFTTEKETPEAYLDRLCTYFEKNKDEMMRH